MLQPNRLGLQKNVACSQSLKVWDSAVGQQRGEGLHNSRLTGVFGLFALGLSCLGQGIHIHVHCQLGVMLLPLRKRGIGLLGPVWPFHIYKTCIKC